MDDNQILIARSWVRRHVPGSIDLDDSFYALRRHMILAGLDIPVVATRPLGESDQELLLVYLEAVAELCEGEQALPAVA